MQRPILARPKTRPNPTCPVFLLPLFAGVLIAAITGFPAFAQAAAAEPPATAEVTTQAASAPGNTDEAAQQTASASEAQPDSQSPPSDDASELRSVADQLSAAVVMRDREQIKDLLSKGADVDALSRNGLTAYQMARMRGLTKIAKMLEALGADTTRRFDAVPLIRRQLDRVREKTKGPGLAVLAARGDEVLLAECIGWANVADEVPVTPATKFRIGSVSKQFTAAAILKLQEEGKLSVDDTLSKYYPNIPNADKITLHHLLTHTSGLLNFTSKPDFYETVTSRSSPEKMIEAFEKDKPDAAPGDQFKYCNTGYFLLGEIVAKVAQQPFAEYLKQTFFEPLEMHDTGAHNSTDVIKHEALGYAQAEGQVTKAIDWDMSRAGGAGNLYSTIHDLHKWNQAIFCDKILSAESRQLAHTNHTSEYDNAGAISYGYGWMLDNQRGIQRISHSGGLQGFVSYLAYYPEHNLTVAALHNAQPTLGDFTPRVVCERVAETFLWQHMKAAPVHVVDTNVDPETYEDYVGRYDYGTAILKVRRDGDRLLAQLTGQSEAEIFPAGNDRFFWKIVTAEVTFARDEEGNVVAAKHAQGIARFRAARLADRARQQLNDDQLLRFVGKYDYPGLGTLTIRLDEGQLQAQMTGQPELPLYAESDSVLFWDAVNAELRFEFDEQGEITDIQHHQNGQQLKVTKTK